MNYIEEINAFEKWLETNYLPSLAQLLWYKLMMLCNKAGWCEWVQVDNQRLMALIQIKREQTFIDLRDKLIQSGLIEIQKGKKGCPNKYKINTFKLKVNTVVNTVVESAVNTGVKTVVETVDIYKQNKTKQNNKKESKKENVSENMHTFNSIIENYTNNIELQTELKNHLKTRKAKKATLTNRAIELSLNTLNKLADNDEDKIELVKYAIERGWTGFFPLPKEKKENIKPKKEEINYELIEWNENHPLYDPAYEDGGYEKAMKLIEEMKK